MRESISPLASFFKERFSPRRFGDPDVSESDLMAILEAASTAPSCYNEQPWRFVVADRQRFFEVLTPGNLEWCSPLKTFILICAAPVFERNQKPNIWARFDCGTAWGYMTHEAWNRGIYMHAMAGFDAAKAKTVFDLGELDPIAVITLGKKPETQPFTPRRSLEASLIRR